MYQRANRALEDTLQGVDATTPAQKEAVATLAFLLGAEGLYGCRTGQNDEGRAQLHRSIDMLRAQQLQDVLWYPLLWLGYVDTALGEYQEAYAALQEGLHIGRIIGEQWCCAFMLTLLGPVALAQGRSDEAYAMAREGLALWRNMGDPRGMAFSLNRFGEILLALKRYDEAHAVIQESLALSNATGNRMDRGEALNVLGQMASAHAQHAQAERLLRESLALLEEIGYPRGIAQAHIDLGDVAYAQGDHQAARRHFAEALHTAATAHLLPVALDALSKIAMLLIDEGRSERALALCAHILHTPSATYATRERTAELRTRLLATLPAHRAAAAEECGRAQPFEAIVAEVLERGRANGIIS